MRVHTFNFPGVEAERRVFDAQGLGIADFFTWQINLVAPDRKTEVPEVDTDLVGAAGERAGSEQRGAVGMALEDAEFGLRWQAIGKVHGA